MAVVDGRHRKTNNDNITQLAHNARYALHQVYCKYMTNLTRLLQFWDQLSRLSDHHCTYTCACPEKREMAQHCQTGEKLKRIWDAVVVV